MSGQTILISGAGIAGCTLAYWLRERGFTPVLIEQAPHFRQGGYMIDFWGIGFDVADRMRLIPALRTKSYFMNEVEFVGEDDAQRSAFGGEAFERVLGDRFFSIRRDDLANTLYSSIQNDVETLFGTTISTLKQDAERVEVTFKSGESRVVDLVIGADGLGSGVRRQVFGPRNEFENYLQYYAASFATEGYPERKEHTYVSFAAPGRQISRYSLRDDRTAFLFVFSKEKQSPELAHDVEAQKQVLRETFSHQPWIEWPEIEKRLDQCTDLYFDAVSQISLASWSQGRIALVGDAAYCPSLLAGEGTAFAMAGAYILAGELAAASGHYSEAFATYERRFRAFIERKQKSARDFASSFTPKTSFGLFVRDQVLRLSSIPGVADLLVRRFAADEFTLPDYETASKSASG